METYKAEAALLVKEALALIQGDHAPELATLEAARRFVVDVSSCLLWSEGRLEEQQVLAKVCSMVPTNLCGASSSNFVSAALRHCLRQLDSEESARIYVLLLLGFAETLCEDFGDMLRQGELLGMTAERLCGWVHVRLSSLYLPEGRGLEDIGVKDIFLNKFCRRLVLASWKEQESQCSSFSQDLLKRVTAHSRIEPRLVSHIVVVEAVKEYTTLPKCKDFVVGQMIDILCTALPTDAHEPLLCAVLAERWVTLVCELVGGEGVQQVLANIVPRLVADSSSSVHPGLLKALLRAAHESPKVSFGGAVFHDLCVEAASTALTVPQESTRICLIVLAAQVFQETLLLTKGVNNCLKNYYSWLSARFMVKEGFPASSVKPAVLLSRVFVRTLFFDSTFALLVHKAILEEGVAQSNLSAEEIKECQDSVRQIEAFLCENHYMKRSEEQPKKKRAKLSISDRFKYLSFKGQSYEIKDKRLLQVSQNHTKIVDKLANDLAAGKVPQLEAVLFLKIMRKSVFESYFLPALIRQPFSEQRRALADVLAYKIHPPLIPDTVLSRFDSSDPSKAVSWSAEEVELKRLQHIFSQILPKLCSGEARAWKQLLALLEATVRQLVSNRPEALRDIGSSLLNIMTNIQYCRRTDKKRKHDLTWLADLCNAAVGIHEALIADVSLALGKPFGSMNNYQSEVAFAVYFHLRKAKAKREDLNVKLSDDESCVNFLGAMTFVMNSNLDKGNAAFSRFVSIGMYLRERFAGKSELQRMFSQFDAAMAKLPDGLVAGIRSSLPAKVWLNIEGALACQQDAILSLPERLEWYEKCFSSYYKESAEFLDVFLHSLIPERKPLQKLRNVSLHWEYLENTLASIPEDTSNTKQSSLVQMLLIPDVAKAVLAHCNTSSPRTLSQVKRDKLKKLLFKWNCRQAA